MFDGKYLEWNHRRIKALLNNYGHQFFHGKRILDLGSGHGDIGASLYRLGAEVTCVDAREEHLVVATKKYPGIKTQKVDLDTSWPYTNKKYDIILDMDLINHLKDCRDHIQKICRTSDCIILETAVCDSDDPNLIKTGKENKSIYDWSFNGVTSYPTAGAIEKILAESGMSFARLDSSKLNSGAISYDWLVANTNECNPNKRRLWFISRNMVAEKTTFPPVHQSTATQPPPNYTLDHSIIPTPFTSKTLERIEQKKLWQEEQLRRQQTIGLQSSKPTLRASSAPDKSKIRLFYNYYIDKDSSRKQEIDFCLQKNIDNPHFEIIIVDSEKNPTFNFFFEKINLLSGPEDISIICNADIFFDDTIKLVTTIPHHMVYALGRWDWHANRGPDFIHPDINQDVWVVRGPISEVSGDFMIGKPGSSGKIAWEFDKAGYHVRNLGGTIKSYHVHDSGIRNHSEEERIPGPYLNVEPLRM